METKPAVRASDVLISVLSQLHYALESQCIWPAVPAFCVWHSSQATQDAKKKERRIVVAAFHGTCALTRLAVSPNNRCAAPCAASSAHGSSDRPWFICGLCDRLWPCVVAPAVPFGVYTKGEVQFRYRIKVPLHGGLSSWLTVHLPDRHRLRVALRVQSLISHFGAFSCTTIPANLAA